MRGTAWVAGAGACAIMLAAGCGSVRYQPADTTGHGGAGTTGHGSSARHRAAGPPTIGVAQAQDLARQLLARVVLPAGARPRAGAAPAALSHSPSFEGGHPDATLDRLWTVSQPMAAILRFWSSHTPAGMASNGSGSSGGGGTLLQFVGYSLSHLPAGVNSATLTMSVISAGPGAVVRADVQVIWYPPRSAAEQVTTAARTVSVTATLADNAHPVTRTFTSPALLRRLAGMLNGVHAAPQGLLMSCPLEWVSYRIAFAASATAAPFLIMSYGGCTMLDVTAGGRSQPPLEMPAGLGTLLQSLTGVRWHPHPTTPMHPA